MKQVQAVRSTTPVDTPAPQPAPAAIGCAVRLCNLPNLIATYGAQVEFEILQRIQLVFDEAFMSHVAMELQPGAILLVDLSEATANRNRASVNRAIEQILHRLACERVHFGFHVLRIAAEAQILDLDTLAEQMTGLRSRQSSPLPHASANADTARDLMIAAQVMDQIEAGELSLAWQPIRSADAIRKVLYEEALSRLNPALHTDLTASEFIPALERTGLIRALDHYVAERVIEELEANSTVRLGLNLSGQSAVLDGWWYGLVTRLGEQPDVAGRLYVEITETACMSSGAQDFLRMMRKAGCHIVLDDFGAGEAWVKTALIIKPEIIKIDGFFIQQAVINHHFIPILDAVVALAANIAPTVVIEGIEGQTHREIAQASLKKSGATEPWQQGLHFGLPSVWKSWRGSGNLTADPEPNWALLPPPANADFIPAAWSMRC